MLLEKLIQQLLSHSSSVCPWKVMQASLQTIQARLPTELASDAPPPPAPQPAEHLRASLTAKAVAGHQADEAFLKGKLTQNSWGLCLCRLIARRSHRAPAVWLCANAPAAMPSRLALNEWIIPALLMGQSSAGLLSLTLTDL